MKKSRLVIYLILVTLLTIQPLSTITAQTPVVNVLFFFSPTCPHCHKVMEEDFPIFRKLFGEQLNIIEVDTSEQAGSDLYNLAVDKYKIPEDRLGVPMLVIGENVLIGSYEIPNMLPQLVESGLSKGGIAVPDLPGLSAYQVKGTRAQQTTFVDLFKRDVVGNSFSVVVLIGLVFSLFFNIWKYWVRANQYKKTNVSSHDNVNWLIPIIALIGLGIACYLSFVEITETEAICGPVGNCNAVQQSPYAKLFGVLPIGVFGIIGYLSILAVWAVSAIPSFPHRNLAKLILWGMTLFGVLFATYLTFLEPFVIGATCVWCLSVAVSMMLLLWFSTPQVIISVPQNKNEPPRKRHK